MTMDLVLSLAEIKAYLRVDHNDDDALITGALEAARRHVEAFVGALDTLDEVPADIVEAMKQLAGHFYATREAAQVDELTTIPFGVHDLIGPYRKWEF